MVFVVHLLMLNSMWLVDEKQLMLLMCMMTKHDVVVLLKQMTMFVGTNEALSDDFVDL